MDLEQINGNWETSQEALTDIQDARPNWVTDH